MLEGFEQGLHDFSPADDLPTVDELVEMEIGGHDHLGASSVGQFEAFSPWDENGHLVSAAHHDAISLGSPDGGGFTHQTTGFTCDLTAEKMILDAFGVIDPRTGEPVSEAQLVYDATVHGWLTDQGTTIEDMGRLLDYYGIDCHHGQGLIPMMQELAHGKQVMVAVDADELWSQDWRIVALQDIVHKSPNHVILIKGIKQDEEGHLVAVVNDPGQPDGAGVEYPLEQFKEAFNDSGYHFVATDHAPPGGSEPSLNPGSMPEFFPSPDVPSRDVEDRSPFSDIITEVIPHIATEVITDLIVENIPDLFANFIAHLGERQKNEFLRNL
jgi:hypothetical protein